MTAREKKLGGVVGTALGLVVVVNVVYPRAIKPLFDVQDRIAELQDELFEGQEKADEIEQARLAYKGYVTRTGGSDPLAVKNRLQARLEVLLDEAGMTSPSIKPRKPSQDRKLGYYTVQMSVDGEGSLESAIAFLRSCYDLPYLSRFKDVRIEPVAQPRKNRGKTRVKRVKLSGMLQTLVLPEHRLVRLDEEQIEQPEEYARLPGDSYAMLAELPFWEPEPPKPKPKPSPPKKEPRRTERPTRKPEPVGDPDRRHKRVAGAVMYGREELQIINTRRSRTEYVATGEEVDGGELVLVHPLGGIVRKEGGYYFYQVGAYLKDGIQVDQADDYPEIRAMASRLPAIAPAPDAGNTEAHRDGPADAGEEAADADPQVARDDSRSEADEDPADEDREAAAQRAREQRRPAASDKVRKTRRSSGQPVKQVRPGRRASETGRNATKSSPRRHSTPSGPRGLPPQARSKPSGR